MLGKIASIQKTYNKRATFIVIQSVSKPSIILLCRYQSKLRGGRVRAGGGDLTKMSFLCQMPVSGALLDDQIFQN